MTSEHDWPLMQIHYLNHIKLAPSFIGDHMNMDMTVLAKMFRDGSSHIISNILQEIIDITEFGKKPTYN